MMDSCGRPYRARPRCKHEFSPSLLRIPREAKFILTPRAIAHGFKAAVTINRQEEKS